MPISVLFDGEAFLQHARGGIPRYLSELIHELRADPGLGIEPVTPYKWVASKHLAEHGGGYVEVPLPRRFRLRTLRRLNARRLRSTAPTDIVHHSLYEPAAFERWCGRKHVTTVYDFMLDRFPENLHPDDDHFDRMREVIERADAVICISEATKADLRRFHPGYTGRVYAIPLGVADSFFDPAPTQLPGLPEDYILSVSNRMGHKGVDQLLTGFAVLAERHPDLQLVLVGAYLPAETERLHELGIYDRTVRLRVSDAVLPWLYRKARLMIYASNWEGFGLPVAEAMASGCPSVVSDIPALSEVGGDAVCYFNNGDQAALLEHAERILTNPAEADRMRVAGIERAHQFTWRRTAEMTAAAYHEVSGSKLQRR